MNNVIVFVMPVMVSYLFGAVIAVVYLVFMAWFIRRIR